jgi:L-rhamnose-H+ transport protein
VIEHFWLGMTIIFVSGVLNGSFALPMKFARRWRWENTWLAFSTVGMIVFPWLLVWSFVPHLSELFAPAHWGLLIYPLAFGLVWGIAQATFGISISAVGMAIAFAVVSGLGCLSGGLVPLLALHPGEILQPRGILLLVSMPILFAGLAYYGIAGRRRERERPGPQSEHSGINYSFAVGLGICIFTGILASAWNVGFAFSGPLIQQSTALGAAPMVATYPVWALVFGAGFIANLLYCAYLLFKNHTWSLFFGAGSLREALLALTMAVLWLSGVVVYGIGATFVGKYGTSVGFTLYVALTILTSNMFGVLAGEWKETSTRTRRALTSALVLTIVSVVILNLGGLF